MTTVLLIRHGRTAANAAGILAGRTPGVLLDAQGRRQARTLRTRLRDVPIDVVVSSPLERCIETADAILTTRPEVERLTDDGLTECDYGQWTGRPLAELAEEPLWQAIQGSPSGVTFPGGEPMLAMAERAAAAVSRWVAQHPEGTVVLVSHGDVIKAILSHALGQPLDQFQRIVIGPGSISVVHYHDDRSMVIRMNDTGNRLPVQPASARPTVGGGTG